MPIWLAARWPNRRPVARALRHDGVFLIDTDDPEALAGIVGRRRRPGPPVRHRGRRTMPGEDAARVAGRRGDVVAGGVRRLRRHRGGRGGRHRRRPRPLSAPPARSRTHGARRDRCGAEWSATTREVPMSDRVTVQITDGVADVRLNRPDKLNALDGDMFVALVDVSSPAGARHVGAGGGAVRRGAGVLGRPRLLGVHGHGRWPGHGRHGRPGRAGADAADAADVDTARVRPGAAGDIGAIGRTDGRITHLAQQAAHGWSEVPVPVIAAVSGHCLGGGLQIALGADLRIVHPDATLSVLEIRWGLSPDMTATATLPRLVGIDVAKELTWTGRNVSGTEAVALGLCTRVSDDPLADALALARDIAGQEPWRRSGARSACSTSRARCRWPSSTPTSATRSPRSSARPTRSRRWPPSSRSGRPPSPTPTETADRARRGPDGLSPSRCSSAARWCWCGWPTAAMATARSAGRRPRP